MKHLILLTLLFTAQADATYYQLQSCQYRYIQEYHKSMYVGIYRSQFGNTFVMYFDTYCPASINQ